MPNHETNTALLQLPGQRVRQELPPSGGRIRIGETAIAGDTTNAAVATAEGHEQAEIEAFLTGPAMNPPLERIQQDPTVRGAVEGQCTTALLALLAFMNE